jgi:AcrR family transcriptional regulator
MFRLRGARSTPVQEKGGVALATPAYSDDSRSPQRGRPRDATRDEALRQAALEVMAEVGYRALTMDAVAARARAGKATIYRRWESKLDLVIDTCNQLASQNLADPDTGSLAGDLREFLTAFAAFLSGPIGKAAQALVGELPHEPELAAAFRETFLISQRDVLRGILERANERGEVRPHAPLGMAVELAGAALIYRLMLTGDPLDLPFVDRVVDQVLLPLVGK